MRPKRWPARFHLGLQLSHGQRIGRCPQWHRAADRDEVGRAFGRAFRLGDFVHNRLAPAFTREDQPGAKQVVQQNVAGHLARVVAGQYQHTVKTIASGGRGRLPAVIGLRRAGGDDGVGLLRQRLGHQEFQFARLVAAGGQAGQVVALNP